MSDQPHPLAGLTQPQAAAQLVTALADGLLGDVPNRSRPFCRMSSSSPAPIGCTCRLRGVQDNPDPGFAERLLLVVSDGLRPPRG